MENNYVAYASTTHLQNGGKFYYKTYFGFEFSDQNDATFFESFEDAENEVKEKMPQNFEGRIFIEDTIDGEETEIFKNI